MSEDLTEYINKNVSSHFSYTLLSMFLNKVKSDLHLSACEFAVSPSENLR